MEKKSKSISLQDRWQSDLKGQYEMKIDNEPFVISNEQIKEYEEKFGIDLTKIPIVIDNIKDNSYYIFHSPHPLTK